MWNMILKLKSALYDSTSVYMEPLSHFGKIRRFLE